MSDQWLKKKNGEPLAVIRTRSDGIPRIFTRNGTFLGEYRPHMNGTYGPNGRFVGFGNLLPMLIDRQRQADKGSRTTLQSYRQLAETRFDIQLLDDGTSVRT